MFNFGTLLLAAVTALIAVVALYPQLPKPNRLKIVAALVSLIVISFFIGSYGLLYPSLKELFSTDSGITNNGQSASAANESAIRQPTTSVDTTQIDLTNVVTATATPQRSLPASSSGVATAIPTPRQATVTPATFYTPHPTPTSLDENRRAAPASLTTIPFSDPANSGQLANGWYYIEGKIRSNSYQFSGDGLVLIADAETKFHDRMTAPSVRISLQGDFDIRAKIDFRMEKISYGPGTVGLALLSDKEPNTWNGLRLGQEGVSQSYTVGQSSMRDQVTWPYYSSTVHLRIIRIGGLLSFYYSSDGGNWITMQSDVPHKLPDKVEAVLFLEAPPFNGVSATFSDFAISQPQPIPFISREAGQIEFASSSNPNALGSLWAFTPGESKASTYSIHDGNLRLTCGNLGRITSYPYQWPQVLLPVSGNFEATVRIVGEGDGLWSMGIGLRDVGYPTTMLGVSVSPGRSVSVFNKRYHPSGGSTNGFIVDNASFSGSAIYLRVRRMGGLIDFSISPDGQSWMKIPQLAQNISDPAYLLLYVESISEGGGTAIFTPIDFKPL